MTEHAAMNLELTKLQPRSEASRLAPQRGGICLAEHPWPA
jgi:hypothetical protein